MQDLAEDDISCDFKNIYQSKVVGTGAVHDGGPAVPCTHPLYLL